MRLGTTIGLVVVSLAGAAFLAGCGAEKAEEAVGAEVKKPREETSAGKTLSNKAPEEAAGSRETIATKLGVDLADIVKHESGLEWIVRSEGTGESPTKGQTISAHYTGYLLNGKKFDSSVDRGQPFQTPIGVGRVIKGWDQAFTDMKVGEKRVLFIPPELGYGARGAGGVIPPNANLVFDVELLGIKQ